MGFVTETGSGDWESLPPLFVARVMQGQLLDLGRLAWHPSSRSTAGSQPVPSPSASLFTTPQPHAVSGAPSFSGRASCASCPGGRKRRVVTAASPEPPAGPLIVEETPVSVPPPSRPQYIPGQISDPNYVRIFDTTLRDGEQSPGATLTSKEKLDIARQVICVGPLTQNTYELPLSYLLSV